MNREQAEQIYLKCRYRTRKLTGDVEMAIAVDAIMEAVAIEREACAKVCESMAEPTRADEMQSHSQWIANGCANAIRARGER